MPYNGTIFIKETSSFCCFYTNSTFKASCEGWIDIWADMVPAVTHDAPGSSRLFRMFKNCPSLLNNQVLVMMLL